MNKYILIFLFCFSLWSCGEKEEVAPQAQVVTPADSCSAYGGLTPYVIDLRLDTIGCALVVVSWIDAEGYQERTAETGWMPAQSRPEWVRVRDCRNKVHTFYPDRDCFFILNL